MPPSTGTLFAVGQLTTTEDEAASLDAAEALVADAAAAGARVIALPENVSFMGPESDKLARAETLDGPNFRRVAGWAARHRVWLLGGTLPERGPTPERAYNTTVLFGPDGERRAVYRKIHRFDVNLGPGATHLESNSCEAGDRAVAVDTDHGRFGLTICYDLRFPDLYRALRRAGCEVLFVPSAFTVPTGRDHWEVLLRARAIESQAYVVAPAQVGRNTGHRQTYGRAMIIDPWGTVVAQVPDRPGFALAEVDIARVTELRRRLPCLEHEMPFTVDEDPCGS